LALAVASVGVLAVAAWLEPDARGYGTHAQLGLPPCGFRWLTGVACPGCGLTTSFAHAIRGQWALAGAVHPLGVVLFVAVCASLPISIVAALRGWSFGAVFDRFALGRWGLAVACCAALVWIVRLAETL
jgi:hypothetical protein